MSMIKTEVVWVNRGTTRKLGIETKPDCGWAIEDSELEHEIWSELGNVAEKRVE